jgi:putative ABC transport system ATP-binding protein
MLIRFEEVSKIYRMGEGEVRALDAVSFAVAKGEFLAVVGQSGSGKSTCMNIIGALDVPTEGHYYLDDQDVGALSDDKLAEIRNRMLGFIFQQYNLIARLDVFENVELPLLYSGLPKKERRERVQIALEKVSLTDRGHHLPNQLSGGQQQRTAIARALVVNPSLILADEPTGALDSRTGREVLELLRSLNDDGNTIILITHDTGIAAEANRRIRLSDGKILEEVS